MDESINKWMVHIELGQLRGFGIEWMQLREIYVRNAYEFNLEGNSLTVLIV